MRNICLLVFLASCFSKPSDELGNMTTEVLKKKEGLDIMIMPIDPKKPSKA